jgi:serine/threonine-protein kinase
VTSALERSIALEEACDFVGAAEAALEAGDARRAVRLAVLGGDQGRVDRAIEALSAEGAQALLLAAGELYDRGQMLVAGRLFEGAGDDARAATCFAAGGDAIRAAAAFERAGRPADGARELERAIRGGGGDGARLALAELCERHGRFEAAAKAVQSMEPGSELRARGLPSLARSLRALGLEEAAREVERELTSASNAPAESASLGAPATPAARTDEPVLFGRFEPRRTVAETPHARVLEALDRLTGRVVALKLLRTGARGAGRDAVQRFEREARALARLAHPAIVEMVDYVAEGPAIALAWMPGGDLAGLLAREPFAPARAAEIAVAVLAALGESHRLGILHRDVKPSNVLFDAVGAPRLSDFGAAHLADHSSTATAGVIGTFAYMSPEQRAGRAATVASDLYGAGALLYQMLTGEPPTPSRSGALELLPSECHPDLAAPHDALLTSLLAEHPDDRPSDAFAARRAIEALPWSTRVVPRDTPPRSRRSARPAPRGDDARFDVPRDPGDGRDPTRCHDRDTSRDLLRVRFDPDDLPRVRAYAAASPRHVAMVYRALPDEHELWVECPRGQALADLGRRLDAPARSMLEHALAALHAAGVVHGAVDAEHVYLDEDGAPFLAWPRRDAPAAWTAADDLAALRRLAAS